MTLEMLLCCQQLKCFDMFNFNSLLSVGNAAIENPDAQIDLL